MLSKPVSESLVALSYIRDMKIPVIRRASYNRTMQGYQSLRLDYCFYCGHQSSKKRTSFLIELAHFQIEKLKFHLVNLPLTSLIAPLATKNPHDFPGER